MQRHITPYCCVQPGGVLDSLLLPKAVHRRCYVRTVHLSLAFSLASVGRPACCMLAGLAVLEALEEGTPMRVRKESASRSSTGMGRHATARVVVEGAHAKLVLEGQVGHYCACSAVAAMAIRQHSPIWINAAEAELMLEGQVGSLHLKDGACDLPRYLRWQHSAWARQQPAAPTHLWLGELGAICQDRSSPALQEVACHWSGRPWRPRLFIQDEYRLLHTCLC